MNALSRARKFLETDPDPETQAELRALIVAAEGGSSEALRDLGDRFMGPLEFGTAGLRGVIGAGESRMNVAVVLRTSYGLGQYLKSLPELLVSSRGVVIGYDGRRKSRLFAEVSASVLASLGIPTYVSKTVCPTPVAAYAVTRLDAAAGIMVTASHNPPEYNGYKVYWGNGAQIIPPHDVEIARFIEAAPAANAVPKVPFEEARQAALVRDFPDDLEPRYLAEVGALSLTRAGDRDAPIVYTPLHGVGNRLIRETLSRAGFSAVHSVAEQAEPDGEFPTVNFPNPEEKGALDLAYSLAEKVGADLIVASDPDVDRLAVAVRREAQKPGFSQLTGTQVGVLLGHYLLTEGPKGGDRTVLASCVSSPQLGAIAKALGVHYEETLTGFKWIANRAMELESTQQKRFVFGYEEALGYTVGPLVRDKDGISAALLFAELWALRRASGQTMFEELEHISRRFGHYVSGQVSLTMKGQDGLAEIKAMMQKLRKEPIKTVGPLEVLAMSDVSVGTRTTSSGETSRLVLPPSNVLIYELGGGSRIIARPSGTEPKIKFYFDVCTEVSPEESLAAADARAVALMETLKVAFRAIAGA